MNNEKEQPTDILPVNWSQDVYTLLYTYNKGLFLLNGVKGSPHFFFNLYVSLNVKKILN